MGMLLFAILVGACWPIAAFVGFFALLIGLFVCLFSAFK